MGIKEIQQTGGGHENWQVFSFGSREREKSYTGKMQLRLWLGEKEHKRVLKLNWTKAWFFPLLSSSSSEILSISWLPLLGGDVGALFQRGGGYVAANGDPSFIINDVIQLATAHDQSARDQKKHSRLERFDYVIDNLIYCDQPIARCHWITKGVPNYGFLRTIKQSLFVRREMRGPPLGKNHKDQTFWEFFLAISPGM